MLQRLVVPLDGSERAEQAIMVAAQIARSTGGTITLARVVRAPAEFEMGLAAPAAWAPAARPEDRAEAIAYLARLRAEQPLAGLPSTGSVYAGPASTMILTAAKEAAADLIIMTSHGWTGKSRGHIGGVVAAVARESEIPVLVLRGPELTALTRNDVTGGEQQVEQAGGASRALAALVPLDGSPLAEAAVSPAIEVLAALAGSSPIALHLLQVIEPLPLTGTASFGAGLAGEGQTVLTAVDETMLGEAEAYLRTAAERLQAQAKERLAGQTVTVTWEPVWSPAAADPILAVSETGRSTHAAAEGEQPMRSLGPSDLIAMATHGRGGLQRRIVGSVTERVLHDGKQSMLVIRPPRA